MPTREIPRDQWVAFFDDVSRLYRGENVSVEALGANIGAQEEVRKLPLGGISAGLKGPGEDTISIILGDTPEEHLTDTVSAPSRVRLEQAEDGTPQVLQIESADGTTRLIRFTFKG